MGGGGTAWGSTAEVVEGEVEVVQPGGSQGEEVEGVVGGGVGTAWGFTG